MKLKSKTTSSIVSIVIASASSLTLFAEEKPISISGVYPHLTMFNSHGECGTGAVVPWAGKLWVITYAPHSARGSSDKLYEISPDLTQKIRPESIGGTPANRMIHRESNQLFIGPYAISKDGDVRAIPIKNMPGRLTGNARHLNDPAEKIYYATMEEALYSVDVQTLEVEELIVDGNLRKPLQNGVVSKLPGYHGKGLYSGQGRLLYSNNGENTKQAKADPTTTSGALAQWFGEGDWRLVRRNQFTELTGPGGIYGNENPETDPVWAMGWDNRSLLLGLLEDKSWTYYRLPKGSHSYDGAHGWNTEWPRIREIGEKDLLSTMHGTFWKFPSTFSRENSAGISPRSNYLKVVGDFTKWNGKIVIGCDDSAKSEFLNVRDFKAEHAAPLQSNSNLWFVDPAVLDDLGPLIGRGSVWLRDNVEANTPSDPYLFSGYDYRALHLTHSTGEEVTFTLEVDKAGNGTWEKLREITLPADGSHTHIFEESETGVWVRLSSNKAAEKVTANFQYRDADLREKATPDLFKGIATTSTSAATSCVMRSLSHKKMAVVNPEKKGGYYELNQKMELNWVAKEKEAKEIIKAVTDPINPFSVDDASVILEEDGQRYRFPKNDAYSGLDIASMRVCREVATERDLINLHGTFYELPARNAQGVAKARPIATHDLVIRDFCSHMGLICMTGIDSDTDSDHIFRSADGHAAIWAGVIDDLWKIGKPHGIGGPWKNSAVKAGEPSDPYIMTAYDKKSVEITSSDAATITLEVDIDGTNLWMPYKSFEMKAGEKVSNQFPEGFSAYWVRAVSDADTSASVTFFYDK
ncbi:hypothetical protein OAB00_04005 [Akkermansiaceae bacterium]|nr:hypothetical protein [Akkermansiaceae bacterium]